MVLGSEYISNVFEMMGLKLEHYFTQEEIAEWAKEPIDYDFECKVVGANSEGIFKVIEQESINYVCDKVLKEEGVSGLEALNRDNIFSKRPQGGDLGQWSLNFSMGVFDFTFYQSQKTEYLVGHNGLKLEFEGDSSDIRPFSREMRPLQAIIDKVLTILDPHPVLNNRDGLELFTISLKDIRFMTQWFGGNLQDIYLEKIKHFRG